MAITMAGQTVVFLRSLLLGVAVGCFYDLFRITRVAFVIPALLVLVEDLLFFLLSSIVLFGFMLENSYGQIRYFILLGVALGWTIYYFTAGSLVMKCSARIIAFLRALLAFLWRPFAWLGRKIGEGGRIFEKTMQNTAVRMKSGLKSRLGLLYNKGNHIQKDGERDGQTGAEG